MVLGKKGGLRSAVKQAGRQATKYAFTITSPSVSGLPERMESSGMILQFARGPKIAATAEADVPAERGPEGKLAWQGESLSFVATLYESKSQTEGKSFSDKRYRISLLGVRPAAFGTNKKATREVAYADVNVADFATCEAPTGKAVWMQVRGGRGSGVTAHFTIAARCVKRSGDGDDDDDDASISSAMTGFSAAPSGFSGDSDASSLLTVVLFGTSYFFHLSHLVLLELAAFGRLLGRHLVVRVVDVDGVALEFLVALLPRPRAGDLDVGERAELGARRVGRPAEVILLTVSHRVLRVGRQAGHDDAFIASMAR